MHEKLYDMKREFAGMLRNNRFLKAAVREIGKMDMIRASMILRNDNRDNIDLERILAGDLQREIPVKDYVFIEDMCELIRAAYASLEMGSSLSRSMILNAYRILSEDSKGYYRKSNPVIYSLNHVPAHNLDIEERLDDAIRRIYSHKTGNNVVLKAMYIHNKIIDVYPFDDYNVEIAIFAMNYYLMDSGITPVNLPVKRREYLEMVSECIKGRRQEEFYNFLCKTVYEKMANTVEACKEYIRIQ